MRNSTILSASSTTTLAAILNVTEARRDVILAVRTEPAVTLETPPPPLLRRAQNPHLLESYLDDGGVLCGLLTLFLPDQSTILNHKRE